MVPHLGNKKGNTLVATGVALRAVRDATDAFPPLKSAVAAVAVVWDVSEVRILFRSFCGLLTQIYLS
jgi:hypothetical protein